MHVKLFAALFTMVLVAIFAVQNSQSATIKFLIFEWSVSNALIIIITAVAGCVIGYLICMTKSLKQKKEVKGIRKEITSADHTIRALEMKTNDQAQVISKLSMEIDRLNSEIERYQEDGKPYELKKDQVKPLTDITELIELKREKEQQDKS